MIEIRAPEAPESVEGSDERDNTMCKAAPPAAGSTSTAQARSASNAVRRPPVQRPPAFHAPHQVPVPARPVPARLGIKQLNKETIRLAVFVWTLCPSAAVKMYGHISDWDTSAVTDMRALFSSFCIILHPFVLATYLSAFAYGVFWTGVHDSIWKAWLFMFCVFISFAMGILLAPWWAMFYSQVIGEREGRLITFAFTSLGWFGLNLILFSPVPGPSPVVMVLSAVFALLVSRSAFFNEPLDKWDVSNLTSMSSMFFGAASFNQPLDKWDVSKVKNMNSMFKGAASFNQPLDTWRTSKVTDMCSTPRPLEPARPTVRARAVRAQQSARRRCRLVACRHAARRIVRGAAGMFCNAAAFNQPLAQWDVSKVTDMNGMFHGAKAFNHVRPQEHPQAAAISACGAGFAAAGQMGRFQSD